MDFDEILRNCWKTYKEQITLFHGYPEHHLDLGIF